MPGWPRRSVTLRRHARLPGSKHSRDLAAYQTVKKIEAYLKPFRVAELRDALARARFGVIRVHEVEELRPADAYPEVMQGVVHQLDVTPRTLLVLLVDDDEVERAVSLIQDVARTDHDHDGRIVITQVEQLVPVDPSEASRARDVERGPGGSVSL